MKWTHTLAIIFSILASASYLKNASYKQSELMIKEMKRSLYQIEREVQKSEYELGKTLREIKIEAISTNSEVQQIKLKLK